MKHRWNVLKLTRTVTSTRRSWLHLGHDNRIHIVNQRNGQDLTGRVTLTPAEFDKFVQFVRKAEVSHE